jgi:hypothetical protein
MRRESVTDEALTALPAYGYLRVPADMSDHQVCGSEQAVIRFAEVLGLRFVSFFFDCDYGARLGFNELITELMRTDARHVVVPSLRHLAHHLRLQDAMQDRLALDAGAEVHAMRR